jgi:hypothetical protein
MKLQLRQNERLKRRKESGQRKLAIRTKDRKVKNRGWKERTERTKVGTPTFITYTDPECMHAEEDAESARQTTVTTAKRDQYFRTTANPSGRTV